MDVNKALPLLAGLSPAQFMRRHWQKKPLMVRGAIPGFRPVLSRPELFRLAARDEVESRLIVKGKSGWRMKSGPFGTRGLPPLTQAGWTLLVQGVDMHVQKVHDLLGQFRFVPDARLDDLMISFATTDGGVGPHFDSYDVFLLQASGRRRWKISKQKDLTLQAGVPLKILQNFEPEQEFLLEAGDMLYLPPRYAHDGIAEVSTGSDGKKADCMTYSIGFRAPAQRELASELLHRIAGFGEDAIEDEAVTGSGAKGPVLYRDPAQGATSTPAAMPGALSEFAEKALHDALKNPLALACALGEYMTELKPSVWFDAPAETWRPGNGIRLHPKSRMMYDQHHVFLNGESYRAAGADARLMQRFADSRMLSSIELAKASAAAMALLSDWYDAGWIHTGGIPAN